MGGWVSAVWLRIETQLCSSERSLVFMRSTHQVHPSSHDVLRPGNIFANDTCSRHAHGSGLFVLYVVCYVLYTLLD